MVESGGERDATTEAGNRSVLQDPGLGRDVSLKAISPAMKVAGRVALQLATSDLFGLLSDQSAQEIAGAVYVAMSRQYQADISQKRALPHTAKGRLNRRLKGAKIDHV